jgi:hypothetical protein
MKFDNERGIRRGNDPSAAKSVGYFDLVPGCDAIDESGNRDYGTRALQPVLRAKLDGDCLKFL